MKPCVPFRPQGFTPDWAGQREHGPVEKPGEAMLALSHGTASSQCLTEGEKQPRPSSLVHHREEDRGVHAAIGLFGNRVDGPHRPGRRFPVAPPRGAAFADRREEFPSNLQELLFQLASLCLPLSRRQWLTML